MMKKTNKIVFYKAEGAGNDFILIDATSQKLSHRKKLVQKVCDRHFGIGADGVVFLEKPKNKKNTFRWDFYNSDGSSAEACMNASRCVVLYAQTIAKKKPPILFETLSGIMKGRVVQNNKVELELLKEFQSPEKIAMRIQEEEILGYRIDTGVPHVVIFKHLWTPEKWKSLALEIQKHSAFQPHQTNVTFVEQTSSAKFRAVTFERGVEDYTLACGTGAAAAGWTYLHLNRGSKVEVQMPGGTLQFLNHGSQKFLLGPAHIVYKGEIK